MTDRSVCILLTDSLAVLHKKGEVKYSYYNPGKFFQSVYFVQFSKEEVSSEVIKYFSGNAEARIFKIRRLNILNIIPVFFEVFFLLKKTKPSLMRAYDPSVRGLFCVLYAKLLKVPAVISVHTHMDEQRKCDKRLSLRVRIFLEYFSIGLADIIICVTDYVKGYVCKYGARHIEVIYNGVDLQLFNIKNRKDLSNRQMVLCVGRLDKQKYQECLIRAMKEIDADLLLVGEGKELSRCEELIINLKMQNKVRVIRSVPHNEINNYYASAKIFAIATHYEGFCIPIIEAMASGIPVVASDIPSIREVMDGAGLLCNNTPEDFSSNIRLLLNDRILYEKLSQKGLERARLFDMSEIEKKQVQVYEKLLEKSKSN